MKKDNLVAIRVWGDYACFTRPEMKVERVSYPLPTPSAARGILEAIYWEPQMYYLIDSIYIIKKGRWFNFRRNELSKVVSINDALKWMKGTKSVSYIEAGGGAQDSAQRNMLALADVEYVIMAEVKTSKLYDSKRNDKEKYLREIKDRAQKGKCFHRPALGCREFAAEFEYVDPATIEDVLKNRSLDIRSNDDWKSAWSDEDLGLMLYDVFNEENRDEGFRWLREDELADIRRQRENEIADLPKKEQKAALKEKIIEYKGTIIAPMPSFFHAKVENSRMDCHPERINIIKAKIKEVN